MGMEKNEYQVWKHTTNPRQRPSQNTIYTNILRGVHKPGTVPRGALPREF